MITLARVRDVDHPEPDERSDLRDREWRAVIARAREAGLAQLALIEAAPLVPGEPVQWDDRAFGRLAGFSTIHLVGAERHGEWRTLCGVPIPAPIRRVSLTEAWIRTQPHCADCALADVKGDNR